MDEHTRMVEAGMLEDDRLELLDGETVQMHAPGARTLTMGGNASASSVP